MYRLFFSIVRTINRQIIVHGDTTNIYACNFSELQLTYLLDQLFRTFYERWKVFCNCASLCFLCKKN